MSSTDVLIIEPSADLASVLTAAFERKGLRAASAHTAQEGIAMADKRPPRMIVMELIMPNHNGVEFIHEFRSYPEWMRVPIIIYSHLAPGELDLPPHKLEEIGIRGHFYKPNTSLAELVGAVESAFATEYN
ncbi:MAG TPA: response regulator [Candidatus Saccharimonadales bacterium]|nr:response regulator [Candidatus Saccharimonadales bacterium]